MSGEARLKFSDNTLTAVKRSDCRRGYDDGLFFVRAVRPPKMFQDVFDVGLVPIGAREPESAAPATARLANARLLKQERRAKITALPKDSTGFAVTYEIVEGGEGIKCLVCGLTSHHPKDISPHPFCGNCDLYHETMRSLSVTSMDDGSYDYPQGYTN
jgi:hypothetical protein